MIGIDKLLEKKLRPSLHEDQPDRGSVLQEILGNQCCDVIRNNLISLTESCKVVDEKIWVKKTIHTLQRSAA